MYSFWQEAVDYLDMHQLYYAHLHYDAGYMFVAHVLPMHEHWKLLCIRGWELKMQEQKLC